jgi:putative endonuclease
MTNRPCGNRNDKGFHKKIWNVFEEVYSVRDYNFFIYLMTNWNNKVLYTGMTNNLERRVYEHKHKIVREFTQKYNIDKLVYYEHTTDVHSAIDREKEIKKWRREKKNKLINLVNPEWKDLSEEWR